VPIVVDDDVTVTGGPHAQLPQARAEGDPALAERMVRAQPFRAGPDTLVRVLSDTVAAVGTADAGSPARPGEGAR
jgi:hypothetical protein